MVTDPSGKSLLSTDAAVCRQVTVANGIFSGVVTPPAGGGCNAHVTGLTPALYPTVQLMPYLDTPNNGGEYKAWLTPADKYACADLTTTCNDGNFGFIDSDSKTDNFKVDNDVVVEIDTRFYDPSGQVIDGLGVTWTDTLGASNRKFSYYAPENVVMHEAHVEAPEIGTHFISIANQAGCTVGTVFAGGTLQKKKGPQTLSVRITQAMKNKSPFTYRIDVNCL
jgi:hypothetical protein